ncbi:hypothetical protein ACIPZF_07190 [Pseudomonas sp. NPDC089752]|uniref:hypothetical protein n=1 Tax=Pseudomonas sp. NPDC089752 TaxID=3364472 RepID=UPI0038292B16
MDTEKYTLWLVCGAALLIDNSLTLQQRQDVLDSVLYAQLRADKRSAGRCIDHGQWFAHYCRSFDELGWTRLLKHHERAPLDTAPASLPMLMQHWLLTQDETLGGDIHGIAQALAAASARKHLARFVQPLEVRLNELGVVSSAGVLALCSAYSNARPAAQADEAHAGTCELRGWVGSVDEEIYALQRPGLRELMERRCTGALITYLGKLSAGGVDGQA